MRLRHWIGVLAAGGALIAGQVPAGATTAATVVIGVDHLDPANQTGAGRFFEYTDFFGRSVKVHQNDTLDFKFAYQFAFHILAVAKSEQFARQQQPVGRPDRSDPPSIATGKPKILLNPIVNGPGSGCGWAAPCTYAGGNDLKISGNPQGSDWRVTITAKPGSYTYFCYIHPGMRGTVQVVDSEESATSKAQLAASSEQQFQQDKAQAEAAERAANVLRFSGDEPGDRTYFVKVGVSAANNHVAIDEMFPHQPLNLVAGDRVSYSWPDAHNVHSVTFPPNSVLPFGEDCPAGFVPPPGPPEPPPSGPPPALCATPEESQEIAADPGNARSGTELTTLDTIVDAGVRLGKDFGLPTTTRWEIRTGDGTTAGSYAFNCNIHDFMRGTLNVAPNGGGDRAHA
jgi:plastocyanin